MPVLHRSSGVWYDLAKKRVGRTGAGTLQVVANPGVSNTPPVGAGYTPFADLYVAVNDLRADGTMDLGAVLTRAPAGTVVTLPATKSLTPSGKILVRDFASGYQAGVQVPTHVKGLWGSGRGTVGGDTGTIISMAPLSSTAVAKGWIPAQGSSQPAQVNVLKQVNPQYPPVFKNLQVAGTEQGHVFSLFQLFGVPGAVDLSDLVLCGWDGNDGAPPGETSALAVAGVGEHKVTRVFVDGRREQGGEVFGAMGATFQNSVRPVFTDCVSQFCRAANYVFFQSFYPKLVDCVIDATVPTVKALGNGCMNLERTTGAQLVRPRITGRPGKVHITHSTDTFTLTRGGVTYSTADDGGGSLEIIDPTWNGLWSDGLLYIQSWVPYQVWDGNTSGNLLTYPNDPKAPGVDRSPRVHKADGSRIPYKWILGQHYVIS